MVHGLGGGVRSHAPYSNLFAALRNSNNQPTVNPINFEHSTNDGVGVAAVDATIIATSRSLGRSAALRANDIAFGHSMGGLTVRAMDREGTKYNRNLFGGFVITGPPIHGSKLPSSFRNGSVDVFFNGLCKEAILDPTLSLVGSLASVLGGAPLAGIVGTLQLNDGPICNMLFELIQKVPQFAAFQTKSIDDFSMNAPYLDEPGTGLNFYTSSTHKVCFMGDENAPVHWRLFSSFINTPDDGSLHINPQDQVGVDFMNNLETFEIVTSSVAAILAMECMFNPVAWQMVMPLSNMSFQFWEGYLWLNQSESQFNNLIGAFGTFNEVQTVDVFNCYGQRGSLESQYQSGQISMNEFFMRVSALYSNPACTSQETRTVQVPLNGKSDGVVPLESQRLQGATNFVLDGVNHFELRDHPTMTDQYDKLFKGELSFNGNFAAQEFFKTN